MVILLTATYSSAAKKKDKDKKDCIYCEKYEKLKDWPESERPEAFTYEEIKYPEKMFHKNDKTSKKRQAKAGKKVYERFVKGKSSLNKYQHLMIRDMAYFEALFNEMLADKKASVETLEGLIKHNGAVKNLAPYKAILKKDLFSNKIVFNTFSSLETQVAAISDDIAYNNHDLQDGLRAGLFTIKKISSIPYLSKLINKHVKNIKNFRREIIINQIVRDLINLMVVDVINTTNKNLKKSSPQSINDIYKQGQLIVDFSDKMKIIDKQIKDFLKRNMYNHKKVIVNTNRGQRIINDLFKYLSKNSRKHISKDLFKNEQKERVIADFIAGMTDRYAINLHKKVK